MKELFKYLKADPFFNRYLPFLRNYKYKILGYNSRKNPVDFTDDEKREVLAAFEKWVGDMRRLLNAAISGKGSVGKKK